MSNGSTDCSQKTAALNVQLRKQRTRKLIELGGLVSKAGLDQWTANALLGAFVFVQEKEGDTSQMNDWTHKGGVAFSEEKTKNMSS